MTLPCTLQRLQTSFGSHAWRGFKAALENPCLASAFTGAFGSGEDSEDQGETLNPEMQLGSIPQCEQKQQFRIGALRLSVGATKLAFP